MLAVASSPRVKVPSHDPWPHLLYDQLRVLAAGGSSLLLGAGCSVLHGKVAKAVCVCCCCVWLAMHHMQASGQPMGGLANRHPIRSCCTLLPAAACPHGVFLLPKSAGGKPKPRPQLHQGITRPHYHKCMHMDFCASLALYCMIDPAKRTCPYVVAKRNRLAGWKAESQCTP